MQVIILTKERVTTIVSILVDEVMILSKLATEYLGIIIDMKSNFFEQFRNLI